MLSSVTLNCQATKIVMNLGSQLSELYSVSQMSLGLPFKGAQNVYVFVIVFVFLFVFFCLCQFVGQVKSPHHSDQMFQRSQVSRIAL